MSLRGRGRMSLDLRFAESKWRRLIVRGCVLGEVTQDATSPEDKGCCGLPPQGLASLLLASWLVSAPTCEPFPGLVT
jgi:hypothetical protein